ncbi:cyanase [Sulfobacillus thermosulfidooxidans]|uniref:cyanase n=1 Tax=Sulfobacillus thermosulfidooxidans TaxID=28034 RepID=UPI0006B5E663|nr:cyanase [Sulfobacillus thermosulfidooxidans]
MDRNMVTQKILDAKCRLKLTWADIAHALGRSEVWTTAACLGQATCSDDEVIRLAGILDIPPEDLRAMTIVPHRGNVPTIPQDPTIYRFYEILLVYGDTIKELIHEKFGDGIMSAIDFTMDIDRKPDPAGDRVVLTMNGKFLPYKKW